MTDKPLQFRKWARYWFLSLSTGFYHCLLERKDILNVTISQPAASKFTFTLYNTILDKEVVIY
jgi:hypothetical protein